MKKKKPKTVTRGLALTDDLFDELKAQAERLSLSKSAAARRALRIGLKHLATISADDGDA